MPSNTTNSSTETYLSSEAFIARFKARSQPQTKPNFLRRIFTRERRTASVFFLLLVTLTYLVIEFAFSAWLVDIMAADSSKYKVELAEQRGRLISGFAVALLFWPVIMARTRKWWSTCLALFGVSLLVIIGVYQGERYLIDTLVEKSSAQSRAAAVTGSLLHKGLATGTINGTMLDGLWADPNAQSTAGKAFAGVVAYMVAQSQSAQRETLVLAPKVIKGVIDQQIGGLDSAYERHTESQKGIPFQYKLSYEMRVQTYEKRLEGTRIYANKAWEKYLDKLESKNREWGRAAIGKRRGGELVPAFVSPRVRNEVRAQGIPVTDSWSTGDKGTFVYLVGEQRKAYLRKGLNTELDGLPLGLTQEQYIRHPQVQKKWREFLQYPETSAALSVAPITREEFSKKYYEPMLASRTNESLKTYNHRADTYGPGQAREEEGKRAYEATIAPIFGLTLSLIGALVHLGKTGLLILQASTGWRFRNGLVKGASLFTGVILISVIAAATIRTPLTSHPTYQAWTQASKAGATTSERLLTTSLDAMIKMQSLAYPVFNVFHIGLEAVTKKI